MLRGGGRFFVDTVYVRPTCMIGSLTDNARTATEPVRYCWCFALTVAV